MNDESLHGIPICFLQTIFLWASTHAVLFLLNSKELSVLTCKANRWLKKNPVSFMPNYCSFIFFFCSSLCEVTMQVPTLEHNNEFKGESLDLIKYIDSHFEGPSLFPHVRFGDKTLLLVYQHCLLKEFVINWTVGSGKERICRRVAVLHSYVQQSCVFFIWKRWEWSRWVDISSCMSILIHK